MMTEKVASGLVRSLCSRSRFTSVYYSYNQRVASAGSVTSYNSSYYSDPSVPLQQFLKVPLFGENEKPFIPTLEEMKKARKLFCPGVKHEIKFLASFSNASKCPNDEIPEVVFIGQSNVGKSSLIKALFSRVPGLMVKVSKKPGHTQMLNFFNVGTKLRLVDVPGYGVRQPKHFVGAVEPYLKTRKNLQRIFLITDGQNGLGNWDMTAIEMLEEFCRPYALVVTKIDLAKPSRQIINLLDLQQIRNKYMSTICFPQPFLVSAVTFEGLGFLQTFVAYVTSNIDIKWE